MVRCYISLCLLRLKDKIQKGLLANLLLSRMVENMNVELGKGGNITLFESNFVKIPFTLKDGFFVGEENVILSPSNKGYIGKANSLEFYL